MISTHDLNLAASKFDLILLLNHRPHRLRPSTTSSAGLTSPTPSAPSSLILPDGTALLDDH